MTAIRLRHPPTGGGGWRKKGGGFGAGLLFLAQFISALTGGVFLRETIKKLKAPSLGWGHWSRSNLLAML
ncbi:MAG: hypothetical protein A2655_01095 [Candidatus Yanofskybacteria bacterium RIFCSPHIGHO2_01_FULL_43_42]|uniref:Uncharacterized protein n=1 Tax=Candidatus Yanofskybacteria bacterium RIFCSPLOWO2_01_FULL_43_22 TaxID=1802695 RepID=A0A1F8GGC3_9BACT|nr:MAG: hypothetical protein A2655_01095 [Candidatus Yanofskybacteria bacterium RIFCSPHIGHO2_01_FULL_43_42]OGN12406.1 MAG: hypothetical protein A3D48_01825 [Candidatus Yanofskybacteria bacterium RIFCSPHIGHO2_02_FULL_43_17]OGN23778.1 MAG: hypothetical protein A3A13_01885 [Candidatus Yanofskybacteria bacterium RIFCSPLOWO2_01_FULL_43_22]